MTNTIKYGAYLLVCSLFFLTAKSYSASEHLVGFKMTSCLPNKICTKLIVDGPVEKGLLAPLFAFSDAKLVSTNDQKKTFHTFHAKDGYYNFVHGEIILREVREIPDSEVIVDLKSGKIKFIKN